MAKAVGFDRRGGVEVGALARRPERLRRESAESPELTGRNKMSISADESAIDVVRRNTEDVQGKGNFELFDELFDDNFVDNTPQPGMGADKAGVRVLYGMMRDAFPDFTPDIRMQFATDGLVTTYKIYRGTHTGEFFGTPGTGEKVEFETVDVMRVVNGKITEHWGVANLLKAMTQIGLINI
jgi:predicted ester cyclase